MKRRTFYEYMDAKGKIKATITNDKSGDHVEKGKGKGKGTDGSKAPKGIKTTDKGFGDLGDKDLVIKFDKDGSTKAGKATKLPTVEFAQYELLPLIRETIESNPLVTEDVVRELKRNGLLGVLVGELLQHRETYQHLADVMAHEQYGPETCRKLVRAMNEEAAHPFRDGLGEEEEEEEEEAPLANQDQEDGAGVEDDDQMPEENPDDDEELELQGGDDDQSAANNNPPGPMTTAMPMRGGPAMQNFQRAMMSYR
jgi:hypothetical protein